MCKRDQFTASLPFLQSVCAAAAAAAADYEAIVESGHHQRRSIRRPKANQLHDIPCAGQDAVALGGTEAKAVARPAHGPH